MLTEDVGENFRWYMTRIEIRNRTHEKLSYYRKQGIWCSKTSEINDYLQRNNVTYRKIETLINCFWISTYTKGVSSTLCSPEWHNFFSFLFFLFLFMDAEIILEFCALSASNTWRIVPLQWKEPFFHNMWSKLVKINIYLSLLNNYNSRCSTHLSIRDWRLVANGSQLSINGLVAYEVSSVFVMLMNVRVCVYVCVILLLLYNVFFSFGCFQEINASGLD